MFPFTCRHSNIYADIDMKVDMCIHTIHICHFGTMLNLINIYECKTRAKAKNRAACH